MFNLVEAVRILCTSLLLPPCCSQVWVRQAACEGAQLEEGLEVSNSFGQIRRILRPILKNVFSRRRIWLYASRTGAALP